VTPGESAASKLRLPAGNQVRLAWPANAPGYTLFSSASLPGGWTTNSATVRTEGTNFVVYASLAGSQKFCRLSK